MKKKVFSLGEIAKMIQSELKGDPEIQITGVADLASATPSEISYLVREQHLPLLQSSKAAALLITSQIKAPTNLPLLICANPELAFQQLLDLFENKQEMTGFPGIHPTAVIHETAKIGNQVTIGPYAVIEKDVVIGDRTIIGASCFIGLGSTLGTDCLIHPHVVIRERCHLGNHIILQPGVILGGCGFGYTMDKKGRHIKLTHVGTVQIEDDVEIGANSCVDRGRFHETRIKRGTKIDNLVQVAHNVILGEDNIVAGQTGIAGSVTTGHHVMLGGQAGVDGHLEIESGTMIAARSGVTKSLKSGKYGGAPAMPILKHNRIQALLRNIETFVAQLKKLQNEKN